MRQRRDGGPARADRPVRASLVPPEQGFVPSRLPLISDRSDRSCQASPADEPGSRIRASSSDEYRDYLERIYGVRWPLAEVLATRQAPVLSIYAVERGLAQDYRWMASLGAGRGKAERQARKAIASHVVLRVPVARGWTGGEMRQFLAAVES